MDHSQHTLHEGHNMDHSIDHSLHHSGMDMVMQMYFKFSTDEYVLFKAWHFTTAGGLIGSMIGIAILAAIYEGLKYFREYLFWKTYNSLQYRAVSLPDKNATPEEPQVVQPTMMSKMHALQTILHMVQMVLSYFLMLIFMTFNVWLCMAVVVGAGIGYFLFGWKKSVVVDVTEHCH
ncbi:high affinity copper uptake protein 1 isoform X2 [Diabrotica virgifera virgifera]|uniref:Copper transport protein n=1 Tax=Diabrotica virgifera virgifera TaxID=50390 RepID=A0A6P7F4Y1_DIAVI|nr:high affinity copper uptake protein 1 isoform X2 [Diabrotica virgifera virgifera]